jgi:hypothetical protein
LQDAEFALIMASTRVMLERHQLADEKSLVPDSIMTRIDTYRIRPPGLRNLAFISDAWGSCAFHNDRQAAKPQIGKTSIAVNLATALAKNGQRVLLIDENPSHNNICALIWALKARFDLLHVINGDKKTQSDYFCRVLTM